MNVFSIPCVVMAAVNFFVAMVAIYVYVRRGKASRDFMVFAPVCLAVCCYDITSAGIYNAGSLSAGMPWQRLQIEVIPAVAASFLWLSAVLTGRESRSLVRFILIFAPAWWLLSMLAGPEYTLSLSRPAIKVLHLFSLGSSTYYEGEIGGLFLLQIVSSFCVFLYSLWLLVCFYFRTKRRSILIIVLCDVLYFVAGCSDLLVGLRYSTSIYICEYAFFLIVMAMTYSLLEEFVTLQVAFADLNVNLEQKVQERTRENEKLMAKLLQSEKIAAIGKLGAGVAHEINNPVGIILGFSQSVVRNMKAGDPLYMPLKSIEREAIRCKKLVADLLTFSRSSKGNMELSDLNEVVDIPMSLIAAEARTRNIEIVRRYTPELPELPLDRSRIQQVVVNLCNNAMQAMGEDGGTITIGTRLKTMEGSPVAVELFITDTGTGMTEEVKKHLFELFFTTKEVGKGTGLGLSLCYDIVQRHNGSIDVESEEGKGSTFLVTIPLSLEE